MSALQREQEIHIVPASKKVTTDNSDQPIVSSTTTGPTLLPQEEENLLPVPPAIEVKREVTSSGDLTTTTAIKEPVLVADLSKENIKEEEVAAPSVIQKATEGTAAVLHAASDTIGSVAGTAKDVAVSATEKLSHVYSDTLQPAAAVVGEKISNVASIAVDKVVEAKDVLTAPETTEKVSHVVQETKDMIVSAAVVTKDAVVDTAHVASDVASKVYHWVADAVVPQMKDQVEAVTETATNAIATTAGFVSTQIGEAKEQIAEMVQSKKDENVELEKKEEFINEPIIQEKKIKEQVKDIAKTSGLETKEPIKQEEELKGEAKEPSPLINMEVFPTGNIPTTSKRTMVGTTITTESEFAKYLQRHEVIPSVFANFFEDKYQLELEFGANTFSGLINKELLFAPGQVSNMPNIYLKQIPRKVQVPSLSNYLGLAMIDADFRFKDAPIDSKKEFIHWLVVNIPASGISSSYRLPIEQGQELVSFMPSQPDEGTGIHRYMFFLFEYENKMNFDAFERIYDNKDLQKRANFDFKLERFVNEHKLGAPVGFFMYQCKNENE